MSEYTTVSAELFAMQKHAVQCAQRTIKHALCLRTQGGQYIFELNADGAHRLGNESFDSRALLMVDQWTMGAWDEDTLSVYQSTENNPVDRAIQERSTQFAFTEPRFGFDTNELVGWEEVGYSSSYVHDELVGEPSELECEYDIQCAVDVLDAQFQRNALLVQQIYKSARAKCELSKQCKLNTRINFTTVWDTAKARMKVGRGRNKAIKTNIKEMMSEIRVLGSEVNQSLFQTYGIGSTDAAPAIHSKDTEWDTVTDGYLCELSIAFTPKELKAINEKEVWVKK